MVLVHHDQMLIIFQNNIAVFAEPWRSPYKCRMVDTDNILGMKIQLSTFCLVLKLLRVPHGFENNLTGPPIIFEHF
jgi:hypothetical protein